MVLHLSQFRQPFQKCHPGSPQIPVEIQNQHPYSHEQAQTLFPSLDLSSVQTLLRYIILNLHCFTYSSKTLIRSHPFLDLIWWAKGFHSTNSQLKPYGTSPRPRPIQIKSGLLRNLKDKVAMGKGGRQSNPVPGIEPRVTVATTERFADRRVGRTRLES